MTIEKEIRQIGKDRNDELAELYARIEVLERNLKKFKEYVEYYKDAGNNVPMGNGRCGYEARNLQNQMSPIMEMAYRVDGKTLALEVLDGLKGNE